jgi:tetratricopeptide (TPR) repeat protein
MDMQCIMQRVGLVCFIILCLALARNGHAQTIPEQDMLRKAQLYEGFEFYDKAIDQYKAFLEQFPKSPKVPEAKAAMCADYLRIKKPDEAYKVWLDLLATTPRPKLLWTIVDTEYGLRMKADEKKARATFEHITYSESFPDTATEIDKLLWFCYQAENNPATFIIEGTKVVLSDAGAFSTPKQLLLPVMLAQRMYEPLMRAGRFEEARQLSQRLSDLLALKNNPYNWMGEDSGTYYPILARLNIDEYSRQMLKRAQILTYDVTPQEAYPEVALINMYYAYAFSAGQVETPIKIHTLAQTELKRLGDQALLQGEAQIYAQQFRNIPLDIIGQQFSAALASKDYAQAKRYLDTLKLAAPDSPVTKKAQELYTAQAPK